MLLYHLPIGAFVLKAQKFIKKTIDDPSSRLIYLLGLPLFGSLMAVFVGVYVVLTYALDNPRSLVFLPFVWLLLEIAIIYSYILGVRDCTVEISKEPRRYLFSRYWKLG